ncbi:MAG: hypothetical protein OEV64_04060 [Desulfobulbaceae bacterium]|nr:hypothetical protein [Desulfobulbaceae bacterium]
MTPVFPHGGKEQACPYWSGLKKYCLLNDDGLYLPFAEHVKIYCMTINYKMCPRILDQFLMGNPLRGRVKKGDKTSLY